jgi:hypothetical protein
MRLQSTSYVDKIITESRWMQTQSGASLAPCPRLTFLQRYAGSDWLSELHHHHHCSVSTLANAGSLIPLSTHRTFSRKCYIKSCYITIPDQILLYHDPRQTQKRKTLFALNSLVGRSGKPPPPFCLWSRKRRCLDTSVNPSDTLT